MVINDHNMKKDGCGVQIKANTRNVHSSLADRSFKCAHESLPHLYSATHNTRHQSASRMSQDYLSLLYVDAAVTKIKRPVLYLWNVPVNIRRSEVASQLERFSNINHVNVIQRTRSLRQDLEIIFAQAKDRRTPFRKLVWLRNTPYRMKKQPKGTTAERQLERKWQKQYIRYKASPQGPNFGVRLTIV